MQVPSYGPAPVRPPQECLRGRAEAIEVLFPREYDQLRRLAGLHLKSKWHGSVWDETSLVHELYLELSKRDQIRWRNRPHFFALASRMMRHILLMEARRCRAHKRGGGWQLLSLEEAAHEPVQEEDASVLLAEVLARLEKEDVRKAQVVEARFFLGLTVDETAVQLQLPKRTVERLWEHAKRYLQLYLLTG